MPGRSWNPQHRRSLAALAAVAATLCGCTVGPNYHPPATTLPTAYITPAPTTPPATAPATPPTAPAVDLAQWWTGFGDPTLTTLVTEALQSNLDLQQATARLVQTRAARGVVAADLWPNVNTNGQYQRSREPLGSAAIIGNSYQAGFDAAWELDIFGGVRRNIEAANADIQAAEEDRRAVQVTLAAEVASNYITLRGLQRQIAVARENLVAQQHTVDITRQKQQAGFVSSLDLANAQAQAATTNAQIPVLEASQEQAVFALSVLLGREPAALLPRLTAPAALPPPPPQIPPNLPADLLRRRPDIRRAEAQVHAATARIGVATADLFPKVSLTGSLGLQSQQLLSLTNANSRFWAFGPTASWPIFDAGKIASNIKVQQAATQQSLLTYRQAVLTALQDVDNALSAGGHERQHQAALAEAVAASRRALRLATELYRNGETDFLNVLNAQGTLLASETAQVQSAQNLDQDLVALYKALGGGWDQGEHGK